MTASQRRNSIPFLPWAVAACAQLAVVCVFYWAAIQDYVANACPAVTAVDVEGGRGGTVSLVVAVCCLLLAGTALLARGRPELREQILVVLTVASISAAIAIWYVTPAAFPPPACAAGSARTKSPLTLVFSPASVAGFVPAGTLRNAVVYFGRARLEDEPMVCSLTWSKLGLNAIVSGSVKNSSCQDDHSLLAFFANDPRWHTGRGLRVGDTVGRLRRLYPAAQKRPSGGWLLVKPSLGAVSKDGRVHTLIVTNGEEPLANWLPGGLYSGYPVRTSQG